jgi:peptide/nickel transport system ATP-binding protein
VTGLAQHPPALTEAFADESASAGLSPAGALSSAATPPSAIPPSAALPAVTAALADARRETPVIAAAAAAAMTGPAGFLRLEHVLKDFSVTSGAVLQRRIGQVSAVADVSFALPHGSTFGLVGESGCGKTTIGRLIVGLEKPTQTWSR